MKRPGEHSPRPDEPQSGARGRPMQAPGEAELPTATEKRHWGVSWIWLIPLAALGVVGWLFYSFAAGRGPLITISFETAEGLSAQQTQVRYKAVNLGTVEEITLTDDLSHVLVKVRMDDRAESMLTENARFWVVRPRLGGGLSALSSGLKTLVSGAYVAIDPGAPGAGPKRHFKGLETPPSVRSDEPGTVYFLRAAELGGVSAGAPIYYRDVRVGEVLGYQLLPDRHEVRLRIFVEEPYDKYVVSQTRFWNTSGVRVRSDARGLSLELRSVAALLSGGVAFETPNGFKVGQPSPPESTFRLYPSRAAAEVTFYEDSVPYVSYFQSSVRGLSVGSEVQMYGRQVGVVTDVALARDPRPGHEEQFAVRVAYVLQPGRVLDGEDRAAFHKPGIQKLVADHLCVVLKTENMLTGHKVLSLEYIPRAEPGALQREGEALVLPSETHDLQAMAESLSAIADQINQIPFAEISDNLNRTLVSIQRTVGGPELRQAIASLDATLNEAHGLMQETREGMGPALERLPRIAQKLEAAVDQTDAVLGRRGYGANSTVQRNLERMMDQVAQASRSIRILSEFLTRHPEALIRGRGEAQP